MQIFAYLKEASISDEDLNALRESGVIPIAVNSFDDIRIIDVIPAGAQQIMLREALKSIKDSTVATRESFAKGMITATLADQDG